MLNCIEKLENELYPKGRNKEPLLIEFFNCLKDPRTSFEIFHSFEKWKLHNIQLLKLHAKKTNYCFIDAGGRDTYKTSTQVELIREVATTGAYEKTIYIVRGEVHLVTMQDELEKLFDSHPYLAMIKGNWNKRDRTYKFTTYHYLYLRVLGADTAGASKAQAAHVQNILIDEAELASSDLISNIMHAMLPGCVLWISGVVNDDRTTALFGAIKNKSFTYFRFASHEGGNWSENKEKLYVSEYGSKNSKGWRNQIEGLWNEPAFGLIPEEDVYKSLDDSPKYKLITDKLDATCITDYKDIIRFNFLPEILEPQYYVGMDAGAEDAPSEILIGAKIKMSFDKTKNIGKEEQRTKYKKIILHRIILNRILGNQLTEVIDYVLCGYFIQRASMDAHIVGRPYFESLMQEKYLTRNYKERLIPFVANENVRIGWVQDKETLRWKEEKMQQKHFASIRMASEFMQGSYVLPKEGSQDLIKSIIGEHAIRKLSAKYPIYENYYKSLEHLFDAFRAMEFAFWWDNDMPARPNEELEDEDDGDELVIFDNRRY